jgi:RHS repeat-associated protein
LPNNQEITMKSYSGKRRNRAAEGASVSPVDQKDGVVSGRFLRAFSMTMAVIAGTFSAGVLLPAHASVQLMQFTVDQTPPLAPEPALASPATPPPAGVQPLDAGDEPAIDPTTEYSSLIRSQSATGALDSGLLGESIDYYTGQTNFVTTDVSLPLNFALPMAVSRSYHVGNKAGGVLQGAFGDWDLEVPRIETVLASSVGWTVSGAGPYNECSDFEAPLDATVTTSTSSGNVTTTLPAAEYSQGYSLIVPGKGRHELLSRSGVNQYAPANDYADYPVVTHDWWAATCKPIYGNYVGQPNERFEVTSPDGVTYDFGYYSQRPYPSYQRIADTSQSGVTAVLPRLQAYMLPNTVTDRFGNWVQYHWTKNAYTSAMSLSSITSSDGRTITISYNTSGLISMVEDNLSNEGKQWTYTYTSGVLTKVTLPDGSYWSINFANLNKASWVYTNPTCSSLPTATYPTGSSISGGTVSGTIQHPTGASGTFTFTVTRHGRNSAPATCLQNSVGTSFAAQQPSVYDVLSLTKKVVTGPNLPASLTWTLAYAGCSTSSCNATKTTKVTDARGFDTLYTFGALYSATAGSDTEGQLQSIQSGGTSGTYLEKDAYAYFTNCGSSCPSTMGTPTQSRGDTAPLSTLKPIQTRTITRDGATYTQTSSNPDTYGFPQTITRTGTDTKTDTLTYHHDTGLWYLGMVTKQVSGGQTEFSITPYGNDLPEYVYRFGRLDKTYTYYDIGAVKTAKDGAGNTTTYSSYVAGIPENVSYADGGSESVGVRYDGRVTTWTDADGNTTSYGYDAIGRLCLITYPTDTPASTARTISWNTPVSGWTRTEQVGSYSKTTTYDAFLQPVQTNEANKRYVKSTFDADGRTTFQSYPSSSAGSNNGITSTYDGLGRLKSQKDAGGYSTIYTPGANTLTVEDRDSNSTTYTFKTYDTPSTAWPVTIASPIVTTTIMRDTWGKPTSIKRGNIDRQRGYNTNQLLSSVTDPERSDALTFDYDGGANLLHVYRNGAKSETRGYDARNRLTSIVYASGDPSVSASYFFGGSLKSTSRGSNSHSYTYSARHEIKTESIKTNSGTYSLGYAYDALAHRSNFTYPDNSQIAFNPDVLGEPTSIGTFAKTLTYYPNGAIDTFAYGNGVTHSMTLSSDGRQLPASVVETGVSNLSYTYDGNSFPLQITDSLHGTLSRTLTYDGGNRLQTANASSLWGNTTFTYDTLDSLTKDVTGSTTTSIAINGTSNLPTSIVIGSTTTALSYDGEGNLKQKGTGSTATAYTFDSANELTQLVQGGTTYTYSYDGKGLRTTSSSASGVAQGQQVDSVYNAAGQLVYESTVTTPNPDRIFANGYDVAVAATQTTKYYYSGNHAVAKEVTAGSTTTDTYIHTDALGSPIAQTDASKNIVGTSAYFPYGGLYSSTGTGNTAGLSFAGQYGDATGLVYMRARYLDPQLRRFISIDPVLVDDGTSLNFDRYSYATNSPYAKIDPSGRDAACMNVGDTYPCNYKGDPRSAGMILTGASLFLGGAGLWADLIGESASGIFYFYSTTAGVGSFVATRQLDDAASLVTIDYGFASLAAGLEVLPVLNTLVPAATMAFQVSQLAGLLDGSGASDDHHMGSSSPSDIPEPTSTPDSNYSSGSSMTPMSDTPFYDPPDYTNTPDDTNDN